MAFREEHSNPFRPSNTKEEAPKRSNNSHPKRPDEETLNARNIQFLFLPVTNYRR